MTAREALTEHYEAVGSEVPAWLADMDDEACRNVAATVIGKDVPYDHGCVDCGAAATEELQVGWDRTRNGGAGGGVYVQLCESHFASREAARQVELARARAAGEKVY